MDQYPFLSVLYELYANKHKFIGEHILIALHYWMVFNTYRLKIDDGKPTQLLKYERYGDRPISLVYDKPDGTLTYECYANGDAILRMA
ncbi:unnamed protein product [Rotaria sordida]|uniref:Uncharacterized protein n=1 Tax=Rotaria sordida TaxID=392033 RepID=A0A815W503_9BILA|nr:unnamed protein product [Rotaria sordida]CAF1522381.1 unnamed protein product [Rotaria sordida]CAF1538740.1 unnamed protein product [Rotaria sordida]CAF1646496.1 unnamed protein product [Rotaria sordida]CAF3709679.1 unnamed protein product [Rotaria sordida]